MRLLKGKCLVWQTLSHISMPLLKDLCTLQNVHFCQHNPKLQPLNMSTTKLAKKEPLPIDDRKTFTFSISPYMFAIFSRLDIQNQWLTTTALVL
jgi:hypothetical protein